MRWHCWWYGHEWFTSTTIGQVTEPWATLPPYVFERDGCIVSAPPCQRCGAENPEAYGQRGDLWFHRSLP